MAGITQAKAGLLRRLPFDLSAQPVAKASISREMLARMENDLRCSAAQLEGRTATRLRYLDDSHIAALRADLVGVGEGAAAEGAAQSLGEEALLSTMSVRTGMDRTVSRKGHSLLVIALQHLSGPSRPLVALCRILPSFRVRAGACPLVNSGLNVGVNLSGCTKGARIRV